MNKEKICTHKDCKYKNMLQSLDNFNKKSTKDGLNYWCKNCCKSYNRKYNTNPDKKEIIRKSRTKWDKSSEGKKYKIKWNSKPETRYKKYKKSSLKRNIPFDLTFEQFLTFWKQPCFYYGCKINTIGIDRVDNSKGYSMENCVSCCGEHNFQKKCTSIEMAQKMIEFVNNKNLKPFIKPAYYRI